MAFFNGQLHRSTIYRTGFGECVVLVLNVIVCPCYLFLDIVLFHDDRCDMYGVLYDQSFYFEIKIYNLYNFFIILIMLYIYLNA